MKMLKKIISTLFSFLLLLSANAQDAAQTDFMRSNGKIYVVVAIVVTILTGLFLYVASIDRKLTRLEKENNQQ